MERRVALVVDHDRATGELIARLLRERGFEVVVATTYTEALSRFDTTNLGLVVIDPVLSDGDGLELVRRAKPSARVVVTTAFPTGVEQAAQKLGVSVVVKPFEIDDLVAHFEQGAGEGDCGCSLWRTVGPFRESNG